MRVSGPGGRFQDGHRSPVVGLGLLDVGGSVPDQPKNHQGPGDDRMIGPERLLEAGERLLQRAFRFDTLSRLLVQSSQSLEREHGGRIVCSALAFERLERALKQRLRQRKLPLVQKAGCERPYDPRRNEILGALDAFYDLQRPSEPSGSIVILP